MKFFLLFGVFLWVYSSLFSQKSSPVKNQAPMPSKTVNLIQNADKIIIIRYKEVVAPVDLSRMVEWKRELINSGIRTTLKKILLSNVGYEPHYKKRCMPVYDYGIQFKAKNKSKTFLFSFRCNTMKIVEDRLYRDFKPQRTELYALLRFEINNTTSILITPQEP